MSFRNAAKVFSPISWGMQNSARAARPFLEQIPREAQRAYQPYINQGQAVDPTIQAQHMQAATDPNALINAYMQNFQQSPIQQYKMNKALGAARASAGAGGFLGTQFDQENTANIANLMAGGDIDEWISRLLSVRQGGLEGLGGISQRGFQASQGLADANIGALQQRGGMEASNVSQRNANMQSLMRAVMSAMGGASVGGGQAMGGQSMGGYAQNPWAQVPGSFYMGGR